MADVLQTSVTGSVRGGIGNIDWTIPNASFAPLGLNKPYVSLDPLNVNSEYVFRNVTYSQNVFSFRAKTLRYTYRPWFTLTDDFANSTTNLEGQSNALFVSNVNTGYSVCLAPDVDLYSNLFESAAWRGIDLRSVVIQGAVPFEVDFNDNIELVYVATIIIPLTTLAVKGKARLQFLEAETPAWQNTAVSSLISVP